MQPWRISDGSLTLNRGGVVWRGMNWLLCKSSEMDVGVRGEASFRLGLVLVVRGD